MSRILVFCPIEKGGGTLYQYVVEGFESWGFFIDKRREVSPMDTETIEFIKREFGRGAVNFGGHREKEFAGALDVLLARPFCAHTFVNASAEPVDVSLTVEASYSPKKARTFVLRCTPDTPEVSREIHFWIPSSLLPPSGKLQTEKMRGI